MAGTADKRIQDGGVEPVDPTRDGAGERADIDRPCASDPGSYGHRSEDCSKKSVARGGVEGIVRAFMPPPMPTPP